MRYDLIKECEQHVRAVHRTAEYDKVLMEVKALLTLAEYMILLRLLLRPVETGEIETSEPGSQ